MLKDQSLRDFLLLNTLNPKNSLWRLDEGYEKVKYLVHEAKDKYLPLGKVN